MNSVEQTPQATGWIGPERFGLLLLTRMGARNVGIAVIKRPKSVLIWGDIKKMNRALLLLFSIAALVAFGSPALAQDCALPATAENGAADLNGDGCLDAADDAIMEGAMTTGDPVGDLNASGTVNVTDFVLYGQAKSS